MWPSYYPLKWPKRGPLINSTAYIYIVFLKDLSWHLEFVATLTFPKNVFGLFFKPFGLRPFNPPRGVVGPFGPKVGKGVENEFPGPRGLEKLKSESEKGSKSGNFNSLSTFWLFLDSVFNFLGPRDRKAPRTHFQLRFQLRPLFKGASFKTQVSRLPTATRTCKWPALWRLHLQMGFATTEPCSALGWLSKAEGVSSDHRTGQSISLWNRTGQSISL